MRKQQNYCSAKLYRYINVFYKQNSNLALRISQIPHLLTYWLVVHRHCPSIQIAFTEPHSSSNEQLSQRSLTGKYMMYKLFSLGSTINIRKESSHSRNINKFCLVLWHISFRESNSLKQRLLVHILSKCLVENYLKDVLGPTKVGV